MNVAMGFLAVVRYATTLLEALNAPVIKAMNWTVMASPVQVRANTIIVKSSTSTQSVKN